METLSEHAKDLLLKSIFFLKACNVTKLSNLRIYTLHNMTLNKIDHEHFKQFSYSNEVMS